MKKISILIIALVIVALAVFVAVGLDGNQAGAFPGTAGFASSCRTCHGPDAALWPHNVPAHAAILGNCANCHSGTPDVGNVSTSTCGACHGGVTVIAAKPTHVTQGCQGCHPAATTTTVAPTTTTVVEETTTTAVAQTTTTVKPTTTTVHATTTTTVASGTGTPTG